MIFHDRSLYDMCSALPRNRDEFGAISGVGASKLEKYADEFLACIAEHVDGTVVEDESRSSESLVDSASP